MCQDTQDIDALYDGMQWQVHHVAHGDIAPFAMQTFEHIAFANGGWYAGSMQRLSWGYLSGL
jgi:hypothetical protein